MVGARSPSMMLTPMPPMNYRQLTQTGSLVTLSNGGGTVNIDDADADPTNELITNTTLNGTTLEITDAGAIHSVDLSSLVDDADADSTNELISSAVLNGTNLEITDAGGTKSVDLSNLRIGSGNAANGALLVADGDTYVN